jgi:hypothetical protein
MAEEQAAPKQDNSDLLKQIQAALSAQKEQAAAPAPQEPTFSPEEHQQFQRFGLDPQRLRFVNTLANFRRGLNLEQDLISRALQGEATPTSGGVMGEEELAQFA